MEAMISFFKIPLVQSFLWAIALIAATAVVARIASRALKHFLDRDSNPLPSSSIIVNIARGVIWATGASIILDACFGVNANALVAALGVGGIAVSLGFQDTLSNLIGGLQVTFMGIVAPGDNIEVGAERGVVQDVTWRHTTIRDAMGQTVIIPNSIISKTALVHLLPASRVTVPFAVPRLGEDGSARAHRRRWRLPRHRRATRTVLRDFRTGHQGQDHLAGRGCVQDLSRGRCHRTRHRHAGLGCAESPCQKHPSPLAHTRRALGTHDLQNDYVPDFKRRGVGFSG